jgi:hypothetical protein
MVTYNVDSLTSFRNFVSEGQATHHSLRGAALIPASLKAHSIAWAEESERLLPRMRPSAETKTAPARGRGKGPEGDRSPHMERAVALSNISSVVEESASRRARISSSEPFTTAALGSSAA